MSRDRTRHVAIGDPQAPIETFLAILDAHGLLGSDGRLLPEVHLVSMGDHFDWGNTDERVRAAESGEQVLSWLASHPADQVTILLGNHDLCRVGELARFDDETFARAQQEADAGYPSRKAPTRPEDEFCEEYDLPSWEIAARDFATFRVRQRTMVTALLRSDRFRVAYAASEDLLLCHAGVTTDELDAIGVPSGLHRDAFVVAECLQDALSEAVRTQVDGVAMPIAGLHMPGNKEGEGLGIFYHRPSKPPVFDAPLRRRFDPARLPLGLTQAIGHIRDKKCRDLLDAHDEPAKDGPLRHLRIASSGEFTYARGVPKDWAETSATMIFLDGGMNHAKARPLDYELLDITTRAPLRAK